MDAIDALFRHAPFDYSKAGLALQFDAMRQAFAHHYGHCAEYRNLCDLRQFRPADLKRPAQLAEIPWVFVGVLKQRDLLSVPRERVYREFTSSGTSGRMSRIYLDRPSFDRVILSARNIHEALGMVSPEQEVNYVCFSYDPSKASDLGTSFTDDLLTGFTARREVFFTFRWSDEQGAFFFDKAGTIDRLEDFQRQGLPVRLLGFPAFIYTLLEELVASRGRGFELGRDSWVMTGGGWKTLADKAVSKQRFVADVAVWLRLPRENIRDMFGMVEHGIPYVDCSRQNLHVPLYARIMVRDPETMELLSPGETGLLHFQTPYLTSYPAHSLLTTDLGTIEPGCPCGVAGPIVTIAGRGGVKKHKGCAITAAELFLRS